MNLTIISHTAHYRREGQVVGWGPTVKEVCWLARVFDSVTHVGCFHREPAPRSAMPYDMDKIKLVLVPPAGGLKLRDKGRAIVHGPGYLWTVLNSLPEADVVHVRCPGIVAMYAIVALGLGSRSMRWIKYAGNWADTGRTPPSFAFQRWWLRRGCGRGPVTINGRWAHQPDHVFTFDNPSMTLEDIRDARSRVRGKTLATPFRFVFAGRTAEAKGMDLALRVVQGVRLNYPDVTLDVLGDGPERPRFESMSRQLGLAAHVRFHGWVPHDRVLEYLARAHFILLPSASEGWPKVLSEAMTYGVVPLASDISAIPQVLNETGAGRALPAHDVSGFVRAIIEMLEEPARWQALGDAGMTAAPRFSYERYLVHLDDMLSEYYGSSPFDAKVLSSVRERLNVVAREICRR